MFTDLKDVNIMSSKEICDLCMKDYQKKSSFNYQSHNKELMTKTTKFLQRIYINLKESLSSTYYSYIYYISFINDQSDMIKIYIMKFKSEVYNMFKIFQTKIERQSKSKIMKIRHDNEEEYSLTDYLTYLKELDIVAEFTVLYTSQQNSKLERLNYSLIFIVRLVLYDKQLFKSL